MEGQNLARMCPADASIQFEGLHMLKLLVLLRHTMNCVFPVRSSQKVLCVPGASLRAGLVYNTKPPRFTVENFRHLILVCSDKFLFSLILNTKTF